MKKVVLAVDSFKGSLSADEVCSTISGAISQVYPDCTVISLPISDGGEGMTDILVSKLNGIYQSVDTYDPLMRRLTSRFGIVKNRVVMEMASSAGLTLLKGSERNPMSTTTYGVGVMLRKAIKLGYKEILIGIGGSATNDAGLGAMQALGLRCYTKSGELITSPVTGALLREIGGFDIGELKQSISGIRIHVACDVNNSLCGPNGAAYVYAPQKGATLDQVRLLDLGLRNVASVCNEDFGVDIDQIPGAGAAGGLGAAMSLFLGAEISSGIQTILNIIDFDNTINGADLVITGEGSVDVQSFMGKALSGVLRHTMDSKIPLLVIGGRVEDIDAIIKLGASDCVEVSPRNIPLKQAMTPSVAQQNIYDSIIKWLNLIKR